MGLYNVFFERESAFIVGKRAAWTWTSIEQGCSWKATVLQSLAPNPTPEPANQGFQDLQKCILGQMELNSARRWPCRTRTGQNESIDAEKVILVWNKGDLYFEWITTSIFGFLK